MKRLTKTYEDGTFGIVDDLLTGVSDGEFHSNRKCYLISQLIDALGAYETTGLTPDKWISIDYSLPPEERNLPPEKEDGWVLVKIGYMWHGIPSICELRKGVWFWEGSRMPLEEMVDFKVTAWMPLPTGPNDDPRYYKGEEGPQDE